MQNRDVQTVEVSEITQRQEVEGCTRGVPCILNTNKSWKHFLHQSKSQQVSVRSLRAKPVFWRFPLTRGRGTLSRRGRPIKGRQASGRDGKFDHELYVFYIVSNQTKQ